MREHDGAVKSPLGAPAISWAQANARWNLVVAILVLSILSFYYLFQVSAGTFGPECSTTNYYDLLCEGFRQGHTYVPIVPRPELLAKANPFDPVHMNLWLWDASLYNKHFYMYWGPVPGLFLLAFKLITGTTKQIIDQWVGLTFALGRLYAGGLLILSFANYARTRQRPWVVGLAILVFGLCSPTPFTIARMHVYEASLLAGQCFLMCGLLAAFWGIIRETKRVPMLMLASLCWGFALGSRVSMWVPAPFLVIITTAILWVRSDRSYRLALKYLLALGIPVTLCVVAHGIYNYARFDTVTEFGINLQLTGQKFVRESKYIFPNIFSYLFAGVDYSCWFPFVIAPTYRHLSTLIKWPAGYATFERAAGMFPTAAFTWLLAIWLWRPLAYLWSRARGVTSHRAPRLSAVELWMLLCAVVIVPAMGPTLGQWEASMRYLGDAISAILMVSTLACFWWTRRADYSGSMKERFWVHFICAGLALHTCFVGAFSGIATYNDQFENSNPALYKKLEQSLSLCPVPADRPRTKFCR